MGEARGEVEGSLRATRRDYLLVVVLLLRVVVL